MSLTKRENEFCRYYADCKNSREAAARAGFAFPERSGVRLLAKESVKHEVERLVADGRSFSSAADGLRKLAFGSVTDAVKLALGVDVPDLESLDLFMVSEIKRTEKGVELKFFDRLKALEALMESGEDIGGSDTSQFVDAILEGASAIKGTDWSESDEF